MKNFVRIGWAIVIWIGIYILSLEIIPSLGFLQGLLKSHPWISKGNITQLTLLTVSFVLMSIFSKGNLSTYGFKSVKIRQLTKPALIGIMVGFLVIVLNIVVAISSGMGAEGGGNSAMSDEILRAVISVWIIASISEEFFYRGLLQGILAPLKKYGFKLCKVYISVPVTFCAITFGLGHFCLLSVFPDLVVISIVISATVLGFVAGYYREKTGSLISPIVVHMMFNIVGYTIPLLLMKLAPT